MWLLHSRFLLPIGDLSKLTASIDFEAGYYKGINDIRGLNGWGRGVVRDKGKVEGVEDREIDT